MLEMIASRPFCHMLMNCYEASQLAKTISTQMILVFQQLLKVFRSGVLEDANSIYPFPSSSVMQISGRTRATPNITDR